MGWEENKSKKAPSSRGGRARRERNIPPPKQKPPGEGIKQTLVPARPDRERGREKGDKTQTKGGKWGKKEKMRGRQVGQWGRVNQTEPRGRDRTKEGRR